MSELVDVFVAMLKQATKEQAAEFYVMLRERAGQDSTNDFQWMIEGSYTHQRLKKNYVLLQERLDIAINAHTDAVANLRKADNKIVRLRNALRAANRKNDGLGL